MLCQMVVTDHLLHLSAAELVLEKVISFIIQNHCAQIWHIFPESKYAVANPPASDQSRYLRAA